MTERIKNSPAGRHPALSALMAALLAVVLAAAATLAVRFATTASAESGTLTIKKELITGSGGSFTITYDTTGSPNDGDITVVGGGSATTPELPEGTYTLAEEFEAGFQLAGWSEGETCDGIESTNEEFSVSIDGNKTVCVYNEAVEEGTVRLKKFGGSSSDTFTFNFDGPEDDELDVDGNQGIEEISLEPGDYVVGEEPEPGFVFDGWRLMPEGTTVEGCGSTAIDNNDTIAIEVVAGDTVELCAYNTEIGASLQLRKAIIGGGTTEELFEVGVSGTGFNQTVSTGTDNYTGPLALDPGDYDLTEVDKLGFDFEGWATGELGEDCPDVPETDDSTLDLDIDLGDQVVICVYNSFSAEGTLEIQKVGGTPDDTFTFTIEGPSDDEEAELEVDGNGGTNEIDRRVGVVNITEDPADGYSLEGWAFANTNGTCPVSPSSSAANFAVNILEEDTTSVCAYNASSTEGTLRISKVGGPSGQSFQVTIEDDGGTEQNLSVTPGNSATRELDAGDYTLSEASQHGFSLEGWAEANASGFCPADPTSTSATFDIEIEQGEETHICVFNHPIPEGYTYTLRYQWNLIAWIGEDGIDIEDALAGDFGGAQVSDISDEVGVIFEWDNLNQQWRAWFANDTVGASDLTTFQRFESYWISLRTNGPAIQWEIETDLFN